MRCKYCRREFTWLSCDINRHLEYGWHVLTRKKSECLKEGERITALQRMAEKAKEDMIIHCEQKYGLKISDQEAEDIMKPGGSHILAMMLLHHKVEDDEKDE